MKLTPEKLQYIRTGLGITQGELARKVGVSSSFLSAIERDERRLTSALESKILFAFENTSNELREFIESYERLHGKGD